VPTFDGFPAIDVLLPFDGRQEVLVAAGKAFAPFVVAGP
jgi:hypothetical protein